MSVTVVATIVPKPEHRAEVISALEVAIADVHANDEGCELYALQEADDRLVMIEKWGSAELLDAHGSSPAVLTLGDKMRGKLESTPEVRVFIPHPAGTPEKGTI
jgi:quinol monooxygenase YgiN